MSSSSLLVFPYWRCTILVFEWLAAVTYYRFKQTNKPEAAASARSQDRFFVGNARPRDEVPMGLSLRDKFSDSALWKVIIPTLFARTKSRDGTENDFRKESYYSTYESRRRKWRCKIEYYGVRCSHFQICLSVLQDNTFPNCESEEISLGLPASRDST